MCAKYIQNQWSANLCGLTVSLSVLWVAATTTYGRTIQYPLSTITSSFQTAHNNCTASKSNSQARIAFKWFLSDNSVIALVSFRLTYPSKACILTAKDLCRHWEILSSCVSEIYHLLAATLSFATLPLGNHSHAISWIIQDVPYWQRAVSGLLVKGKKPPATFKIMSTVIGHPFFSTSIKTVWNTFHDSLSLHCTDPKLLFVGYVCYFCSTINFTKVIPK